MPDQTELDDYNDPTPEQALEWVDSFITPVTPFVHRRAAVLRSAEKGEQQ